MHAEVRRPDGTSAVVNLKESEPGIFEGSTSAALSGVYTVRFRSSGTTMRGFPFTREETRTGLAWRGGDNADPNVHQRPQSDWCDFLHCLITDGAIRRWLEKEQIEPHLFQKCLESICNKR